MPCRLCLSYTFLLLLLLFQNQAPLRLCNNEACRWRAIFKYMSEMRLTTTAHNFCPMHAMRIIRYINNTSFADGLIETRPSATAFKFGIAFKQWITADGTIISSYFRKIFKLTAPRPFRSFLPGNLINIFRQNLLPFFITRAPLLMHLYLNKRGSFFRYRSYSFRLRQIYCLSKKAIIHPGKRYPSIRIQKNIKLFVFGLIIL